MQLLNSKLWIVLIGLGLIILAFFLPTRINYTFANQPCVDTPTQGGNCGPPNPCGEGWTCINAQYGGGSGHYCEICPGGTPTPPPFLPTVLLGRLILIVNVFSGPAAL